MLRQKFMQQARQLAQPVAARVARRKARKGQGKAGSGGGRFTARNLADDYIRLCHAPLKDLKRWLAEDKKAKGYAGRNAGFLSTRGMNESDQQRPTTGVGQSIRLYRQPLHELRGRLDPYRHGGRDADGLLARSRAGAGRYDPLRSLRGEGQSLSARAASGGGFDSAWPDAMKRELAAAKTPADRLAWASRWGAVLSGQVADVQRVYRPPLRPAFRRSAKAVSRPTS
jgi:hypothetical protein